MKITLLDPNLAGPDARERRAGGEANQARWRAELELAQWQSRLRYRPPADDRARAGEGPAARRTADLPPSRSDLPGADAVALPGRHQAATRPVAVAAQAQQAVAMTAQTRAVVAAEQPLAVMPGLLRPQVPPAAAAAAQSAVTALVFEPLQWPATASHVSLQGNRLSVALRDPGIAEQDWPALRDRLQAQCAACGLELGDLTINGKRVEPVGSALD